MGRRPAVNQSLRRQRRLLAVRSLQADFAAAELRRSQMDAAEVSEHMQQARLRARPEIVHLLSPSQSAETWVLSCAEQELAGMEIDRRANELVEIDARPSALSLQESQARQEREQIKMICDRLKQDADYTEQISDQSALDDLFSASLLRRCAGPKNSSV